MTNLKLVSRSLNRHCHSNQFLLDIRELSPDNRTKFQWHSPDGTANTYRGTARGLLDTQHSKYKYRPSGHPVSLGGARQWTDWTLRGRLVSTSAAANVILQNLVCTILTWTQCRNTKTLKTRSRQQTGWTMPPPKHAHMCPNQPTTRFMAIIQVNLHQLAASAVKNWRILLVQSFTAHMPLLMATGCSD